MLLTLDLGNSNASVGLFNGRRLVRSRSVKFHSMSELEKSLRAGVRSIDGACVASVVPSMDARVRRFLERAFGVEPLFANHENAGMSIRNYNAKQLGADRIVAAVAAYERYKKPLIVIDAGTAITIDFVNRKGEFVGGAIVPGLHTACESLHLVAEKLPLVSPTYTRSVRGKDTRSAINSGVVQGYAGMVDHLVREMGRGSKALVVATGGDAKLLKKTCDKIDKVHPNLVLEGLRIIWERNN
jgi:type III pantothenate kinase